MQCDLFDCDLWSAVILRSRLFTSHPFEPGDLFGTSVRSLAVFLLCWDSSGGAPANHCCSPLKHSCLWAVARTHKTKSPFMWMCECLVETQLEVPKWRFWSCNRAAVPWIALSERSGCGCWCRICKPTNNCGLCFFSFVCRNSVLLCFVDLKNLEKLAKVQK